MIIFSLISLSSSAMIVLLSHFFSEALMQMQIMHMRL